VAASSGAPADTKTTTFSSEFSGPVTTVSAVTGFEYCLAQVGSWDMSMVRGFTGVPSKVTAAHAPFCGLAEVIVIMMKPAAIAVDYFSPFHCSVPPTYLIVQT